MIIIGIDPDSEKSGVATHIDGFFIELECKSIIDIYQYFESLCNHSEYPNIQVHIENVSGTSHNFTAKKATSLPAKLKIARNIGRCEQVQIEIERIAEHFNIPVFKHSLSSKWKKGKYEIEEFKRLTGCQGQSNEDTRSAAYFGYLGVLKNKSKTEKENI